MTREDYEKALEWIFRPMPPPKPPQDMVNWDLMIKHRIRHAWDGETILFSSSELKRARACGAITRIGTP